MKRLAALSIAALTLAGACGDSSRPLTEPRLSPREALSAAISVTPSISGATVDTDKDDYAPGEVVTIIGRGWRAGERVHLKLVENPVVDGTHEWDITADADGNFIDRTFAPGTQHLGVEFTLTAAGPTSGTSQAIFTDGTISNASIVMQNATCAALQSTVVAGTAICASAGFSISGAGATKAQFRWRNPSGTIVHISQRTPDFPNGTSGAQGYSASYTPTVAGTWTVLLCESGNADPATFGGGQCASSSQKASQTFTVTAADVATSLSLAAPSPTSVTSGSAGPVALSATLTRSTGGTAVPGATVAFTVGGNPAGSATTDASGVASVAYNPSALTVGSYTIQATFTSATISGTVYLGASSGTQALSVNDASGPVIVPTVTGTLGGNGWYTSDVQVSWSVTDPESTVGSTTGCGGVTTISTDTDGQTVTCTATSAGGTSPKSVTIKRDATAPAANANRAPAANAHGWNNTNVTVSFTGTDGMSGIASCSADVVLSSEGANQSASGTCVDNAGNTSAPAGVTGINIDKMAPTWNVTASPAANANGWNKTDVMVSFNWADALSGLVGCTPDATVSSETAPTGQTRTGNCADKAGNAVAPVTHIVRIDRTAPTISGTRSPAANADGWNNTNVTVSFTCADALSGVESCSGPASFTSEGDSFSATGNALDRAGNTASTTVSPVKIDKTAPVVNGVSFFDADIQAFSGTALLSATIADALSGGKSATYTLNGAPGGAMTVNTAGTSASASITNLPAGLYSVCVQATDRADNVSNGTTVERCAYLAVYDPNGGFVTGGGWINSLAGACKNWSGCTAVTAGKANFGFVSKYLPGRTTAPEGNTEFQFHAGNLKFKSTSYQTLIVAGDRAQFWGVGTVNGEGGFAFRITAIDGTPDKFRMEIWNGARDDATAKIYDNQWGDPQDASLGASTVIAGGSIQIKK